MYPTWWQKLFGTCARNSTKMDGKESKDNTTVCSRFRTSMRFWIAARPFRDSRSTCSFSVNASNHPKKSKTVRQIIYHQISTFLKSNTSVINYSWHWHFQIIAKFLTIIKINIKSQYAIFTERSGLTRFEGAVSPHKLWMRAFATRILIARFH